MAFTNRWVCIVDLANIDPKKILKKDGLIESWDGEKFELSRVIKFDPPIYQGDTEVINYLSGKIYYQWEDSIVDFSIVSETDTKGQKLVRLAENTQMIRRTTAFDFWMALNRQPKFMLFKNSNIGENGVKHLSELLFDKTGVIKPVTFDTEKIEEDVKNGVFNGMWAFHFTDRNGSINTGILYAEDSIDFNNDDMYIETIRAPRGFVGIKMDIDGRNIKLRVSKRGSITIYKNLDPVQDIDTIFSIIEMFTPYMRY